MKLCDLPKRCFQGVLPGVLATCDAAGIPNVTYLSQVFYVDERHVALSCQFFNKTKRNVLENPHASVQFLDPQTIDTFLLSLRYDHAETQGPLFEAMSRRIEAIASHTGMAGVFKLLSADVYEVLAVERVAEMLVAPAPGDVPDDPPLYKGEVSCLQLVSQRAARATDLESLLTVLLQTLEEAFGFQHSMVLLCDESEKKLFAIESRGYGDAGVGAEVGIGEGLIGTVARERCVLRVAGVGADLRYGRAIRTSMQRVGAARALQPEVPLPGLVDAQSQIALPLVAGDRLVGVLAVESRSAAAFDEWHEAYLEIIANQVASAIDNMVARARDAELAVAAPARAPQPAPGGAVAKFKFYRNDDCVFFGDEYLVRNVPGRILWKLLRAHASTGRVDFTNRELRLDPALGLPALRDNLESRLVLLRKRLKEKCPELRIVPTSRGQFRLEVGCRIDLEELDCS